MKDSIGQWIYAWPNGFTPANVLGAPNARELGETEISVPERAAKPMPLKVRPELAWVGSVPRSQM